MKTPEQIKSYIAKQEWFKRLGINLDDIQAEDFITEKRMR